MRFLFQPPRRDSDVHFLIRSRNGPRIANPILTPLALATEFSRYTHNESMIFRRGTPAGLLSEFAWFDWISPVVQLCESRKIACDLLFEYDRECPLLKETIDVTPGKFIAFAEAAAHPPGEPCIKRRSRFGAVVLSQNLTPEWVRANLLLARYVVGTFETEQAALRWINAEY